MKAKVTRLCTVVLLLSLSSACSSFREINRDDNPASRTESQSTSDAVAAVDGKAEDPDDEEEEDDEKKKDSGMKPYDEVITDDAISDEGLFLIHRLDGKLFYEIPDSLLGTELLLVTRIAATANRIGFGGMKANTQVLRWQRQDDDILVRIVSYENIADPEKPIYQAVVNSNFEPVLASFDIKAINNDSTAVVIDVTKLFTTDIPSLGLQKSRRETYKVKSLDKSRSFISSAASYPQNIEVRHVLTYSATDAPSNKSSDTISLEMNQSMIVLPADPMQPRLCDNRVGFFRVRLTDYGRDVQKADERCYVTRWRLEPSDPAAYARGELVEPVKPIVYYIDPATPEQWRPYLKQGVNDWNKAFENAGFKNAIEARDPPSREEDPEFSPEDVRYSVIRYYASPIQNAFGPHVHDPRSGEILESDIGWYHNVMKLLRNWYFVQTAAVNPDARGVEFRDEVMGQLIRFVSAHEVGHTIGLPHNWGSSYAYPVDSLRSKSFTDRHGTAPSIMDYARFNYVAQPEDGVTNLMPAIGDYDKWAIKWAYTYLPEDGSPDDERTTLNSWIVERADDPVYFYGRQGPQIDPRSQREDLGDNAVRASDYGINNLKVIVQNMVDWTSEEAKDYSDLTELYNSLVGQWALYIGHVTRNVGGSYETFKTYDQEGPVYEFVSEEKQRESLRWLDREVFATPEWLINRDLLRRIEGDGALDRVRQRQVNAINLLLDPHRFTRMIETQALAQGDVYTVSEMLADLRWAVWKELTEGGEIDVFRRNLQRGYVERMEYLLTEEPPEPSSSFAAFGMRQVDVSQSDIRAYVRGELVAVRDGAARAARRYPASITRLHLEDIAARIDDVLEVD